MITFFSTAERDELLEAIQRLGQSDHRVSGGALVGSFATQTHDHWSDIDISFGIKANYKPLKVLNEWTTSLQQTYELIHYFDVKSGSAIYRVLLFANGIEVDLSVVPENDYGPRASSFKLFFGATNEQRDLPKPDLYQLFGWSWHHVLHANAAIHRDKLWQAEYWINSLRSHLVTLHCLQANLPAAHGRGADLLPKEVLDQMNKTLVRKLDKHHLRIALQHSAILLIAIIQYTDSNLAQKLSALFKKVLGQDYGMDS